MKQSSFLNFMLIIYCVLFTINNSISYEGRETEIFQSKIEDVFYEVEILNNANGYIIGFYFTMHNTSATKDYDFYLDRPFDSAYSIQFYNFKSGLMADSNFNLKSYNSGQPSPGRLSGVTDYAFDGLKDSSTYSKIILKKESSFSKYVSIPNEMKEKSRNTNSKLLCSAEFYFHAFIYQNEIKKMPTKRIHKIYFADHLSVEQASFNFYGAVEMSAESFSPNLFKNYLKTKKMNTGLR